VNRVLCAALAAVVLLVLTAACEMPVGVPAGTVTSKGIVQDKQNHTTCYWLKVRDDKGRVKRGCVPVGKWKKVGKGDHWAGQ
jgi:hypothetical protein